MNNLLKVSLLVAFFSVGCSSNPKSLDKNSLFSGTFSCPGYKGKDNNWASNIAITKHEKVNGVDIIVTDNGDRLKEKTGPYTKTIMIADGKWRYSQIYRNKKIYPIKVKSEFIDNKLVWHAEYPELIDNKGAKRVAQKGNGTVWVDSNGDKVSTGSHYKGEIKCKRL